MKNLNICISAIYASCLLFLIPIDAVLDRQNYLNSAQNGWSDLIFLGNYIEGIFKLFVNEPLWLIINIALSKFFNPEFIVGLFVFIPAFITSYILLKNNKKDIFFVILFLVFPQIIKNHVIHLRQGIAIMFFLFSYYSSGKLKQNGFLFLASLIHSSFFLVIVIKLYLYFLNKSNLEIRLQVVFTAIVSLIIGSCILFFAELFGASQAQVYLESKYIISGIAFIFWFIIILVFVAEGNEFIHSNMFSIASILLYLATYFLTPVTARVFESSLAVVMISGLNLGKNKKAVFILFVILNAFYFYSVNYGKSYFGWQSID